MTRVPRVFRDRLNPIEELTETECIQRFRFDRNGIMDIRDLLKDDLIRPTNRSCSLTILEQVCSALRYFSQGAFQRVTGEKQFAGEIPLLS